MEDSYPEGSILLNLGSGDIHWDAWINVDSKQDGWNKNVPEPDLVCDITKLPYPKDYADVIAAVHVVEHFYRWEIDGVLKHWHSILKPNGKLILELPCMNKVFGYIMNAIDHNLPMSPTFSWWPLWGDPKYQNPAMVHKWGYTVQMINEVVVKAGFVNVRYDKPRYHFPNRDMRITAIKPSTT